ncbi:hypothetical protein QBC43DRAFT_333519 [Cladorrhinum sp. PSN259]|nr:hypothetical protein QBC43DRAFT_333519 [Cladorrhinum sp. PSN259]
MAWHLVGATVWPLILFWEAGKKLVRGIKRRVNHQVGSGKDGSRGGRVMSDDDDDDDDETPNTPPSDENNLTRIVIRKRPPQTKKEEEGGQGGTSRSTTANTTGTQSRRRRRRRRRTRHETGAALQRSSSEQEITRLKEKFSSRENPLGIVIPDLVGGATSSSLGTVRYYCPRACPRPPYLDFEENGRNLSGVKCRCASVRKAWSLDDMRSMRSMSERVVRDTNGDIHGGGGGGRATQHPSESNHSSPGFALNGAFGDGKRPLAPPLLPLQRRRSFEGQVNGVYPEGRPMAPERRGSKNNGNGDTLSGKPKIMKKQSRKGSKHDLRGLSLGTIYEEEDELEEHRGVGVSVNEREESRSTPKTRTRGRGRDSSQTSTSDSEAYKCREQCQCAAAINIS